MNLGKGDRFSAYGREFIVEAADKHGVWTRRVPNGQPGEPTEGEHGFFEWEEIDRLSTK